MLEATVIEAGAEYFSKAARPSPCEHYSDYCASRRELLRQRVDVRAGKFEASTPVVEDRDKEL